MAKPKGLKEGKVHMGLFDFTVVYVIGDYKHLSKYIQWKFDDKDFQTSEWDMEYECRGKCIFRKGYVPVVWIPRKPKTKEEYGTLAHECIHAVFHLFEWSGMPITRDTEEVMTHSVAHLIRNIL